MENISGTYVGSVADLFVRVFRKTDSRLQELDGCQVYMFHSKVLADLDRRESTPMLCF